MVIQWLATGYVGVSTCGPQSLMDDVRRSASRNHAATFHVHTETFEL
jgi:ferredoxin-NADP reductase